MKYTNNWRMFANLVKDCRKVRLLGLHVRETSVGLAHSDVHLKIARPLKVLNRGVSDINKMAGDFSFLISQLNVKGLVIGYPLEFKERTPACDRTDAFVEQLKEAGTLPDDIQYTFWDESFTTESVTELLKPYSFDVREAKRISDKFAAQCILQDYLDYGNWKSIKEEDQGGSLRQV